MFTGIVEETGTVRRVEPEAETVRIEIAAAHIPARSEIGSSVAVSGVCLTVVAREAQAIAFDLGPETLRTTTLGRLRAGDRVNLERPLRLGGELGGHLVLGHVDGVGTITAVERHAATARIRIALPDPELRPLLIPKGSVAVDGVSLTVADLDDTSFDVMVIPHTLAVTTLGRVTAGGWVNLEMDVIGKYLVRSLTLRTAS
jgi:riboflavin synthase